MFAIIAAVLFALALLFELIGQSFGPVITVATAGLLCVALHMAGAGTVWRGRGRWRRRRG